MATRLNLSEIPPPDIVKDLNYEANVTRIKGKLTLLMPGWKALPSDPIMKVVEVIAYEQVLIQAQINESIRQTMIAFSKGSNLDNLGALFGIVRSKTTLSDGTVVTETDDNFREVIISGPDGYSTAGTENSYEYHIRKIANANDSLSAFKINLSDVNVYSPEGDGPRTGKVQIVILFSDYASESLTDEIVDRRFKLLRRMLETEGLIPTKDVINFKKAIPIRKVFRAVLTTPKGPDKYAIISDAKERVKNLLERNFKIGREIGLSAILAALHVEGVTIKVNVTSERKPFTDDLVPEKDEFIEASFEEIDVNDAGK